MSYDIEDVSKVLNQISEKLIREEDRLILSNDSTIQDMFDALTNINGNYLTSEKYYKYISLLEFCFYTNIEINNYEKYKNDYDNGLITG
jgi:hypothetical protein